MPDQEDPYDMSVYAKAARNISDFLADGTFVRDDAPSFYIYAQTMDGRVQTGIVGCVSVDEYIDGTIKKHELTRVEKEIDRINHFDVCNADTEPVFLAYRDDAKIRAAVDGWISGHDAEYDITTPDGIRHRLWKVGDAAVIAAISCAFAAVPELYIADGHHRSAAAARVGAERAKKNPNHTGEEEYNYFMAVCFPEDQLKVLDYNRVLKDLNGLTPSQVIGILGETFDVTCKGTEIFTPDELHTFSMYLEGKWYELRARPGTYNDHDPIGVLDVTILSERVLGPVFGIKDLRTDSRIDFVGGIRGLGELKRRVDSGEMKIAFALYPVSMKQITDIADSGNIMPPKTTWFEPKLRSGLAIHTF